MPRSKLSLPAGLGSLVTVTIASGLAASPALADPLLSVQPTGGQAVIRGFDLATLAAPPDVQRRSYTIRTTPGTTGVRSVITGYSLGEALDGLGIPRTSFSVAEIQGPPGIDVLLTNAQVYTPGAFPDGPPVISGTNGSQFLRPSTGPADANADDVFSQTSNSLPVILHSGALLTVKVAASPVQTTVGRTVKFTSSVSGAAAGETLTYAWQFDDGTTASGPTATHRFPFEGAYDVSLRVTGSADAIGASASLTIRVGTAPPGPARRGGGTNRRAGAPDHGAGKPAHTTSPKRATSHAPEHAAPHRSSSHAPARPTHATPLRSSSHTPASPTHATPPRSSSHVPTAPRTPPPPTRATLPPPATTPRPASHAGPPRRRTASHDRAARKRRRPAHARHAAPANAAGTQLVSGLPISDPTGAPPTAPVPAPATGATQPATAALAAAAATTAARTGDLTANTTAHVPDWLIAALGVVGTVGGGVLLEHRSRVHGRVPRGH